MVRVDKPFNILKPLHSTRNLEQLFHDLLRLIDASRNKMVRWPNLMLNLICSDLFPKIPSSLGRIFAEDRNFYPRIVDVNYDFGLIIWACICIHRTSTKSKYWLTWKWKPIEKFGNQNQAPQEKMEYSWKCQKIYNLSAKFTAPSDQLDKPVGWRVRRVTLI